MQEESGLRNVFRGGIGHKKRRKKKTDKCSRYQPAFFPKLINLWVGERNSKLDCFGRCRDCWWLLCVDNATYSHLVWPRWVTRLLKSSLKQLKAIKESEKQFLYGQIWKIKPHIKRAWPKEQLHANASYAKHNRCLNVKDEFSQVLSAPVIELCFSWFTNWICTSARLTTN